MVDFPFIFLFSNAVKQMMIHFFSSGSAFEPRFREVYGVWSAHRVLAVHQEI